MIPPTKILINSKQIMNKIMIIKVNQNIHFPAVEARIVDLFTKANSVNAPLMLLYLLLAAWAWV